MITVTACPACSGYTAEPAQCPGCGACLSCGGDRGAACVCWTETPPAEEPA